MKRKKANEGEFAKLEVPMQKRAVEKICRKYCVDISGLIIKIQRDPTWLKSDFCGMADPKQIGRIDLTPNAFENKQELIKTIIHEGVHVKQYRKYGSDYVQRNRKHMEEVAYRYEKIACKILGVI